MGKQEFVNEALRVSCLASELEDRVNLILGGKSMKENSPMIDEVLDEALVVLEQFSILYKEAKTLNTEGDHNLAGLVEDVNSLRTTVGRLWVDLEQVQRSLEDIDDGNVSS